MELWRILHRIRDGGRLRNRENDLKELQEIVDALSRAGPFVGRILTKGKMYAGKIEKLKLSGNYLEFTVIDSDKNGETDGGLRTHQGKIPLGNLEDIQIWYKKDKPLSLDDLLNDRKTEDKND